jgi:hypothetical protein
MAWVSSLRSSSNSRASGRTWRRGRPSTATAWPARSRTRPRPPSPRRSRWPPAAPRPAATHLILGREREGGLPEHEHRPAVRTVHQAAAGPIGMASAGSIGSTGWRTRPTLCHPQAPDNVPVIIGGRWRITAHRHAKSPAQKARLARPVTSMSGVLGPARDSPYGLSAG